MSHVDPYDELPDTNPGARKERDRLAGEQLHAQLRPASYVLEIGAGFGGHARALADRGHRVVAVELSRTRAEAARRVAFGCDNLTVVQGDAQYVDAGAGFDVVICRNSFGVADLAPWRAVLSRIPLWLGPNGAALVDVFDAAWWSGVRRVGRHADGRLRVIRYSRQHRCLHLSYFSPRGELLACERVHCVRRNEIALWASEAGLVAHSGPTSPVRGTFRVELRPS